MSNKRIQKKHDKKTIKIKFKNEFEVETFKSYPRLSFQQTMILYDYCTYNILRYANNTELAQDHLKHIVDLRYEDMEVRNE